VLEPAVVGGRVAVEVAADGVQEVRTRLEDLVLEPEDDAVGVEVVLGVKPRVVGEVEALDRLVDRIEHVADRHHAAVDRGLERGAVHLGAAGRRDLAAADRQLFEVGRLARRDEVCRRDHRRDRDHRQDERDFEAQSSSDELEHGRHVLW
jgi:hypothetical protein